MSKMQTFPEFWTDSTAWMLNKITDIKSVVQQETSIFKLAKSQLTLFHNNVHELQHAQ